VGEVGFKVNCGGVFHEDVVEEDGVLDGGKHGGVGVVTTSPEIWIKVSTSLYKIVVERLLVCEKRVDTQFGNQKLLGRDQPRRSASCDMRWLA
jgi:hypothetical protein